MIVRKVSDIRIRTRDTQGNLVWKSLRAQKIRAQNEWRDILPEIYRLSHNGFWYELAPASVKLIMLWEPYPSAESPETIATHLEIPLQGTKLPEALRFTMTKEDEYPKLLRTELLQKGDSFFELGTYLKKFTNVPIQIKYQLEDGKDVEESIISDYIINTTQMVIPNLQVETEEVFFNNTAGESLINISAYTGDLQYSRGNPPTTATWSYSTPELSWAALSKYNSDYLKIKVENNPGEDRIANITLNHVQYPFITKNIKITQSSDLLKGIPSNSEWLLIQFNWIASEGKDLDNKVLITGLNNSLLNGNHLGFDGELVTYSDIYNKDGDAYYVQYTEGARVLLKNVKHKYFKKPDGTYTLINDTIFQIPFLKDSAPIILWGGDKRTPESSIKISGESYIINLRELKNNRNLIGDSFKIMLSSHWWDKGTGNGSISVYMAAFDRGTPVKHRYDLSIIEAGNIPVTPIATMEFSNIPVIDSQSTYTPIANIKYVKRDNWQDDYFEIEKKI